MSDSVCSVPVSVVLSELTLVSSDTLTHSVLVTRGDVGVLLVELLGVFVKVLVKVFVKLSVWLDGDVFVGLCVAGLVGMAEVSIGLSVFARAVVVFSVGMSVFIAVSVGMSVFIAVSVGMSVSIVVSINTSVHCASV